MTNTDSMTIDGLRAPFGACGVTRVYSASGGRASHLLEEAQCSYGLGRDAIRAVQVLTEKVFRETPASEIIDSPIWATAFLKARLADLRYEAFGAVFLGGQNGVVAFEKIFRGTATKTLIYPREIVKRALAYNASALIYLRQHPSGNPEPSRADKALTRALQTAFAMIEVRPIGHIVMGGDRHTNLAKATSSLAKGLGEGVGQRPRLAWMWISRFTSYCRFWQNRGRQSLSLKAVVFSCYRPTEDIQPCLPFGCPAEQLQAISSLS